MSADWPSNVCFELLRGGVIQRLTRNTTCYACLQRVECFESIATSCAQCWSESQIDGHLQTLRMAVNEIFRLWANNYRFVSEERLRSHLKKTTGYRKIKGDYLKEQARRFLTSAQKFIDKGAVLWQV